MRHALPVLVLALTGCGPQPYAHPALDLRTELAVKVEDAIQVGNASGPPVTVTAIDLDPPVRGAWVSSAATDWVLDAGDENLVTVAFKPDRIGEWTTAVRIFTDGDSLTVPLTLTAEPGADVDGDGMTVAQGDCDDDDPTTYFDADELCDGRDNDCDGDLDEDFDFDEDGFLDAEACPTEIGTDCGDQDPNRYPGATERCDFVDTDCNGTVDDIDVRADEQDGVCAGGRKSCVNGRPTDPDWSTWSEDWQLVETRCDGLDNDCDGGVDDFDRRGDGTGDCIDDDGDGFSEAEGDCDDGDPALTPASCGAPKLVVTSSAVGLGVIDLNLDVAGTADSTVETYAATGLTPSRARLVSRSDGRVFTADLDALTLTESGQYQVSPPWAIEDDRTVTGADDRQYVLLQDGRLVAFGIGETESWELPGEPRAMTTDPDTGALWIVGADGWLTRLDPLTESRTSLNLEVAFYTPPVIDPARNRVVLFAFDAFALVSLSRDSLSILDVVETPQRPVRGAMVGDELWVTSGVDDTVEVFDAELSFDRRIALDGQAQGIWHDAVRDEVWVAVYGEDEVVCLLPDPVAGRDTVRTSHPVPEPIQVVPVPALE